MSPEPLNRNRWGYAFALIPMAGLLWLLLVHYGVGMASSALFALPFCLVYIVATRSSWYLCRVLPLTRGSWLQPLSIQLGAAMVAALLWIGIGALLAMAFPAQTEARLLINLPILYGIGVTYFMLVVTYHYMIIAVERSRRAEQRTVRAEADARQAELKALRAQLNPHFLFNSLNAIAALATNEKAREMTVTLSDFLRGTLRLENVRQIPLTEELELARQYLRIEQIRFENRLTVVEDIAPDVLDERLPPLLLQPLVENAIKHGIAELVEGGSVRLAAHRDLGHLRLVVENSIDADARVGTDRGHGLAIVAGRLQAAYGAEARLETLVREGDERRFRAVITLPLPDPDEDE